MEARDVEGQHRRFCEWHDLYVEKVGGYFLFNMDKTERLRVATDEEIDQAMQSVEKLGTSTVMVDGQEYLLDHVPGPQG